MRMTTNMVVPDSLYNSGIGNLKWTSPVYKKESGKYGYKFHEVLVWDL